MSSKIIRAKSRAEESDLGDVLLWIITIFQIALFALFVGLVLVPYYGTAVNIAVDPRNVPPFSWSGFGLLLYELTFTFLLLSGPLGVLGLIAKVCIFGYDWRKMLGVRGAIHVLTGVISLLVVIVWCSFGSEIYGWLLD